MVLPRHVWLRLGLILSLSVGIIAPAAADVVEADGKIHVTYWEKWNGFEGDAMQRVVDHFNRRQDRIVVHYFSTSQIDRKTLVATAGGDPPDVAGLWEFNVAAFADAEALLPFDDFIRRDGGDPATWLERYYPVYARMCQQAGRIYAAISTPATVGLYWNRALFRDAGLDPDQPPRTFAELEAYNRALTRRNSSGDLIQTGLLPQDPGWWNWALPIWFGGSLFRDGAITIARDPANLATFRWVENVSRELGLRDLQRFTAGFGPAGGSEAAFITGRVAMTTQGVWYDNYIGQFRPGLDYGVAPWPQVPGGPEDFAVGLADVLCIPRGARNPDAAWEFVKYLTTANLAARSFEELEGVELLSYLQKKNSPLRQWSPYFTTFHPNPNIAMFRRLSASSEATGIPHMGLWQEYNRELNNAFERVRLLEATPEEAVRYTQERLSDSWARYQRSLMRHGQLPAPSPPTPTP